MKTLRRIRRLMTPGWWVETLLTALTIWLLWDFVTWVQRRWTSLERDDGD